MMMMMAVSHAAAEEISNKEDVRPARCRSRFVSDFRKLRCTARPKSDQHYCPHIAPNTPDSSVGSSSQAEIRSFSQHKLLAFVLRCPTDQLLQNPTCIHKIDSLVLRVDGSVLPTRFRTLRMDRPPSAQVPALKDPVAIADFEALDIRVG